MVAISVDSAAPILTNTYDISGNIISQTLPGGARFQFHYVRDPRASGNAVVPDLITEPNGLLTYIRYEGRGYTQSLPLPPAQ
jgi:YD repeat-containing protein